jgi:hypothetical protein
MEEVSHAIPRLDSYEGAEHSLLPLQAGICSGYRLSLEQHELEEDFDVIVAVAAFADSYATTVGIKWRS